MDKGIVLLCFGKFGYYYAAHNLAYSIKFYNPELHITLLHDEGLNKHLTQQDQSYFDSKILIQIKATPALTKANIYEWLPYEYNLFLDIDAIALQDITPCINELIEKGGNYYSSITDVYNPKINGSDFSDKLWAKGEDIYSHYNLSEETTMYAIQSSFQFIKKCPESENLFKQLNENLENPLPLSKLKYQWGGGQPDELYMGVALAQLGINPDPGKSYVFYGGHFVKETRNELKQKHILLSLYGGAGVGTKLVFIEWYDKLMHEYKYGRGYIHRYKSNHIIGHKVVNKRNTQPVQKIVQPEPVQTIQRGNPIATNDLRILVKFPTRSRPEKFINSLTKMMALAVRKNLIEVIVSYDEDDATMTPEIIVQAESLGNIKCVKGVNKNKVDAVNRDMDKAGQWDIILLMSDDMVCQIRAWDDFLRLQFNYGLDLCPHFNDGYKGTTLCTLAIMGKTYYERFNYIYNPCYTSLFCDNESMEVAKKLNRYKYINKVLFKHEHYSNGRDKMDELMKHTESFYDSDNKIYNERKKVNFGL